MFAHVGGRTIGSKLKVHFADHCKINLRWILYKVIKIWQLGTSEELKLLGLIKASKCLER